MNKLYCQLKDEDYITVKEKYVATFLKNENSKNIRA